jgi:hypothetical protein
MRFALALAIRVPLQVQPYLSISAVSVHLRSTVTDLSAPRELLLCESSFPLRQGELDSFQPLEQLHLFPLRSCAS